MRDGLIWVEVTLERAAGGLLRDCFVLDTGTPNTILSLELAEHLGYPESRGSGVALFDTPDGPVLGYTARIAALRALGRSQLDYLVGVKVFHERLHVPGILGLDFFADADLLLSFRSRSILLTW